MVYMEIIALIPLDEPISAVPQANQDVISSLNWTLIFSVHMTSQNKDFISQTPFSIHLCLND